MARGVYERRSFAESGHATWDDVRQLMDEWVKEIAGVRGLTVSEFVGFMALDPVKTAAELTEHCQMKVTKGQVKKWCKRWMSVAL